MAFDAPMEHKNTPLAYIVQLNRVASGIIDVVFSHSKILNGKISPHYACQRVKPVLPSEVRSFNLFYCFFPPII